MNTFNFTRNAPTVEIVEQYFPETYKAVFDSGFKRGHEEGFPQGIIEGKQAKAEADKNFMQSVERVCSDYWAEKSEEIRESDAYRSVMPSSCASVEDRAKAEWDKNANVRSEFTSFASFLAYTKACETGQVRGYGGMS